jgi:hypothetical protein
MSEDLKKAFGAVKSNIDAICETKDAALIAFNRQRFNIIVSIAREVCPESCILALGEAMTPASAFLLVVDHGTSEDIDACLLYAKGIENDARKAHLMTRNRAVDGEQSAMETAATSDAATPSADSVKSKARKGLTACEQHMLFKMAVGLAENLGCVDEALDSLLAAKAKLDALGADRSQLWL